MAAIRGDDAAARTAEALALVQERRIAAESDLGTLLQTPPAQLDPEVFRQLRFIFEAGGWVLLESALADLPADLRWLFESGAVTLAQLVELHRTLGITSAADLAGELRRDAVRRVPGFDPGVEAAVAHALKSLRRPIPRIPLGRAKALADPFLRLLRGHPGILWAEPVGSLRRGQDSVGDIEIVAPAIDPLVPFDAALAMPDITRCLHRGPRRLYLLTDRVQIGIRSPKPEVAGGALLHLTGNTAHIEGLGTLAAARGWKLEPEALVKEPGAPAVAETEEEIYAALGLPWIPPEIRNGDGEIAAAASNTLPSLVSRGDIKGDLHMHTHFSDGRDTVEEMVAGCVALGYQYLAITDHSPHSAATRNLSIESVKRQADEIAALRTKYPAITILHGFEVDILLDGRLDFPDRVLQEFDIVLASLHESGGQPSDDASLHWSDASFDGHDHHAPDQSVDSVPARIRARLRPALRHCGRNAHGDGNRRRTVTPGSRWSARAPRGEGRSHAGHRQRLPSRGFPGASDGARPAHGKTWLDRTAARAQHAADWRGAEHHRSQTIPVARPSGLQFLILRPIVRV